MSKYSKTKIIIEKYFDKLTERERAILSINAFGHGDKSEAIRLIDASPRVSLVAPDCGQWVMRFVNVIEWHCLKQAQNAANMFLIGIWADANRENDKPEAEFEDNAVRVVAHNIIARANGWKIFCGEFGLDPLGALRIVAADEMLLDYAEEIARRIDPDLDAIHESAHKQFGNAFTEKLKLVTADAVAAEYRELLNVKP